MSLDESTYDQLKNMCAKKHIDMSAYLRTLVEQDINEQITEQNLNFISTILREQLDSVLELKLNRLYKLGSATCIQAGAAAYLSAEALSSFVPINSQQDFTDAYNKARKKSVAYIKNLTLIDDIDN